MGYYRIVKKRPGKTTVFFVESVRFTARFLSDFDKSGRCFRTGIFEENFIHFLCSDIMNKEGKKHG